MATINVRQLDGAVAQRLKRRATGNNRSLEGEVRHILEGAVEDDMSAKRASFLAPGEAGAAAAIGGRNDHARAGAPGIAASRNPYGRSSV